MVPEPQSSREPDSQPRPASPSRSSEGENTFVGDDPSAGGDMCRERSRLTDAPTGQLMSSASVTNTREQESRLGDDLAVLKAEREASSQAELGRLSTVARSRSRRTEPVDEFDINTNPVHEQNAVYRPPEHPSTRLARFFKTIHNSSFIVRYFMYIIPVSAVLLVPLLLGALVFTDAHVGGVELLWFSVWLEIVWLTLWAGRILAKIIPWPLGLFSSLFTNNSKKWRDMGKQLELPATLFFWWLGVEVSFLPTMTSHTIANYDGDQTWLLTINRIIISVLVGAILNFIEKIIIQLIAISFHLRTYADRIELNKFQIGSLVKLYRYSKNKIALEDSDFEEHEQQNGPGSGARTPMQYVEKAQKNVTQGFRKVGDVAGKVAGDFTGKQVTQSTHPNQVVLTLLNSAAGSQVLARRLYRTFIREGEDNVSSEDMRPAFENGEEADAAFTMFDKDLNGDISMAELESVCVEIGRERKSITASLKDLDSVVSKLDAVLFFVVVCVTVLVLITLISTSAAGVLTSAGSTVLALSWLFSATAQEFLQSVIFVFVKHPFDVGDRVSIYGNTGAAGKGDDYFVKEISLLYTEFKKMEGHIVQAPNSYLNTLFILNVRRSGGLAEAVPLTVKFGTTLDQIDLLRNRLLDFVKEEKREYQGNILTEIREVVEAHSINLNVVFFYKSNWQNELLRLQRRNKFICAMMLSMLELGIEGPRMRIPGQKEDSPFYVNYPRDASSVEAGQLSGPRSDGHSAFRGPNEVGSSDLGSRDRGVNFPVSGSHGVRKRGESVSSIAKKVDFSLGMKDVSSGDIMGDIFDDRRQARIAELNRVAASGGFSRIPEEINTDAAGIVRTTSRDEQMSHPRSSLNRSLTESQHAMRSSFGTIHRPHFLTRGRGHTRDQRDEQSLEEGIISLPEEESTHAGRSRQSRTMAWEASNR